MDTKFGGEGFWNVIVGEGFEVQTYTGCPKRKHFIIAKTFYCDTLYLDQYQVYEGKM